MARNKTGRKILLIFDGHGSHITDKMIELAIKNNIELFCLPPHTTHKLQPLDVGVFGPLQKAWVRQCDDYLARTGQGMQKRHVVREYMKARERSFTENTILQAWKKCGIRELEGIKVFTEADFAPSQNTSTRAEVPASFPQELPSDFEPWPGTEAVDEQGETTEDVETSYREFSRIWLGSDSRKDNDEEGNSGSEDENSDEEGGDVSMEEDGGEGDNDDQTMDKEDGTRREIREEEEEQGRVDLNEKESEDESESETRAACDPSASTPSGPRFTHVRSTSQQSLRIPKRSRDSEMSKRLDKLLRPLPSSATKDAVVKQNTMLQAELAFVRAERNYAQSHAIFARQELQDLKIKVNSRTNSKKRRGDDIKVLGELVTGPESSERRKVRRREQDAKEQKKAEVEAQKAAKAAEDQERRTQMQRNPNHAFSGSLSSKNKSELGDILIALGILVDAKAKKADMVKRIQDHFNDPSHIEDRESPRFSGLFPGARRPRQPARQPELEVENNPPPHPQWPGIYQPTPGPSYSYPQTSNYRYHPYTLPQSYYHPPFQFSHGASTSSVMPDSRNFTNHPPPPPQM